MQILQRVPIVIAVSVLTLGAVLAGDLRQTSESFGPSTFRERTDQLTLIASTSLASQRSAEAYIPIPIAVGYVGKGPSISITPESFTLVDAAGNRYPLAGFNDVRQNYPKLRFDRSILRAQPLVVGLQFETSRRVAANFFPAPDGNLRTDHINLSPFMWFTDVLYVERPAHSDGVMTLEFKPHGLQQQLAVRIALAPLDSAPSKLLRR